MIIDMNWNYNGSVSKPIYTTHFDSIIITLVNKR